MKFPTCANTLCVWGLRLEADITFTDMPSPYAEKTLYFEVDKAHGDMLADDTYDAFVLVPLYLAMYHKQDLHIRGNISKKLYQNIKWYIPRILCDFSDDLAPVKFTVDGFTSPKRKGNLIGTGISCGVDSLSTIYDRFVKETDPDCKINALFFFNCGANGVFTEDFTTGLAQICCQRSMALARELGLPLCPVDTNLHNFRLKEAHETWIFLATYSCVLALQNVVRRYYISSGYSYAEIKGNGINYNKYDFAGYCESFFVPLIQTERIELVVDGCQYRRVDKLKKIADWDIARKYLNVCSKFTEDASNCGVCTKCLRTLLALEILGKINAFADIFDIEHYRQESFNYKALCALNVDADAFAKELVDLAAEYNFPMPQKHNCYVLDSRVMIVGDK